MHGFLIYFETSKVASSSFVESPLFLANLIPQRESKVAIATLTFFLEKIFYTLCIGLLVVMPMQNFTSKNQTGVKIVFLFYAWLLIYCETSKVTSWSFVESRFFWQI
jgi:hypothetical protein